MLDTAIVVALVTGAFTLLGTIISVWSINSKTLYRIEQLEKKMDKHNNVIERVYKLEENVSILQEKINNQNGK